MVIILSVIFFFLILRFAVTLFNFVSNPKLRRVVRHYHDKVSILIPARDEAADIIFLLESIRDQDYLDYEVLILDDNSSDDTYFLCQAFAAKHPKFRVIKGEPLPANWLGKNYACYQLAHDATGRYLMFIDADEQIYKGLINSAVHRMQQNKLALLSLFTDQEMLTWGEKLVVPLMHYTLLNLLPLKLVYFLKSPLFAAASGQFMLFDAEVYRQNQWHEQVQAAIVEDIEIMRNVKAAGYRGEALLANGLISCRMYTGYKEAIDGFSKNFLAAFNYNILGLLIYLVLVIGGPLIIISTLNLQLIVFMCGIIMLGRSMIAFAAGQDKNYNMLLHPVQMVNMAYIGFLAIQRHLTKTNVWKGRRV
ncbi:glycosyltransferase [Mucilaginibacter ginkgonis]|uniref:Glycosyltransferase family 2 protein n=1 Tax=Mucilaginibacter ginkgonis TaxID=2682091 RepID=A0A6I4I3X8_9SPHI|nr:glycosyltransferase family 2 protein [Mucilaginibacter ginkgonis]QQL49241.1 glycosyltransferase family 2 protein [Mucilaginibacter ginkgonis]